MSYQDQAILLTYSFRFPGYVIPIITFHERNHCSIRTENGPWELICAGTPINIHFLKIKLDLKEQKVEKGAKKNKRLISTGGITSRF